MPILILLALAAAAAGLFLAAQVTLGVGLIGVACLLAILARIAQASRHHDQLMKLQYLEAERQLDELEDPVTRQ